MMTPPTSPFPPPAEIVLILLAENIFGWGFNVLVAWVQANKIWHVSISVAMGVAMTMIIPVALWWNWELTFSQAILLLFGCFVASGVPMIYGSTKRTVVENHKALPWPRRAAKIRDDVIMDASRMITDIEEKANDSQVTAGFLLTLTNGLHGIIKILKSV